MELHLYGVCLGPTRSCLNIEIRPSIIFDNKSEPRKAGLIDSLTSETVFAMGCKPCQPRLPADPLHEVLMMSLISYDTVTTCFPLRCGAT